MTGSSVPGIAWRRSSAPVGYDAAVSAMEARVAAIREGTGGELVWLLEHPALYTAGTSAVAEEILDAGGLPVFRTGRGGRVTYHGPGQRIAYVMLDLERRGRDLRRFVHDLEAWLIEALAALGVAAFRREGRVGIWVGRDGSEAKIAAIGVRVRRWVSYHGIALNVAPDLARYRGIVPCGLRDFGVTSLADMRRPATMDEVDSALRKAFESTFTYDVRADDLFI